MTNNQKKKVITQFIKNKNHVLLKKKAMFRKRKKNWTNCPCASAHVHFCLLNNLIFSLQFSLHFGEKTFW